MSDEQYGSGAPTDEERARAVREQLRSLHAFDLAYEMMISLVSFGYQKMGLTDETSVTSAMRG
jgi:glutamate/tyrosine decarboxylase-like PLP-dependent enzyme